LGAMPPHLRIHYATVRVEIRVHPRRTFPSPSILVNFVRDSDPMNVPVPNRMLAERVMDPERALTPDAEPQNKTRIEINRQLECWYSPKVSKQVRAKTFRLSGPQVAVRAS
jgi:hypothetical protein